MVIREMSWDECRRVLAELVSRDSLVRIGISRTSCPSIWPTTRSLVAMSVPTASRRTAKRSSGSRQPARLRRDGRSRERGPVGDCPRLRALRRVALFPRAKRRRPPARQAISEGSKEFLMPRNGVASNSWPTNYSRRVRCGGSQPRPPLRPAPLRPSRTIHSHLLKIRIHQVTGHEATRDTWETIASTVPHPTQGSGWLRRALTRVAR